jgi:hypothetical protein
MSETAHEPKEDELPGKKVSAKAMGRLTHAKAAIATTKSVLNFGAGNQIEAISGTNMNSKFRLLAMRNPQFFELAPELHQLASENYEAYVAAQADLVHGGNCGEHAWIAYDYLRRSAKGDTVAYTSSELDHAFVLLGDREKESDTEVVVADPWPTQATACLWQDHFCRDARKKDGTPFKVTTGKSMIADGTSHKNAIRAGLRLTAEGKAAAEATATDQETADAVAEPKKNHFWRQPDTTARDKKFNYHQ